MEKKKSSRIAEIIVITVVIICLGLIVIELSNNVSNKIAETQRQSRSFD